MEDIKNLQKVLVVVKGGVVQSLYVSDKMIEVDVLDFDDETVENAFFEDDELRKRSEGLIAIL